MLLQKKPNWGYYFTDYVALTHTHSLSLSLTHTLTHIHTHKHSLSNALVKSGFEKLPIFFEENKKEMEYFFLVLV